ncbi:MAG TPA: HAD family hydrolase [Candidatus Hydrogenedentes bacterium]|nr:HAD family hydrolase [Candidatus Hydrogenedentota bacterium]HOS03638.1 HAD family hydrolase [Candidatus Hydrogenedentota bacterium]
MMVRAITFDFWRTLFRDAHSPERQQLRVATLVRVTGLPEQRINDALGYTWAEFNRHHLMEQRTLGPEDAVRLTLARLDIQLDPDAFREAADAFGYAILQYPPEPIEGALEAVRAAAERVPVGVISDSGVSPGRALRILLARNGFAGYFRALIFSDEIGVAKPQRPMFETAARSLGVAPEEMLHIGDLEGTDIAGALNVGAQAALFLGDAPAACETTRANHVFTSWPEFVSVLPGLVSAS